MPGYQVTFQNVAIAGATGLAIRCLRDRQQYFDPLGAAEATGVSPANSGLLHKNSPT